MLRTSAKTGKKAAKNNPAPVVDPDDGLGRQGAVGGAAANDNIDHVKKLKSAPPASMVDALITLAKNKGPEGAGKGTVYVDKKYVNKQAGFSIDKRSVAGNTKMIKDHLIKKPDAGAIRMGAEVPIDDNSRPVVEGLLLSGISTQLKLDLLDIKDKKTDPQIWFDRILTESLPKGDPPTDVILSGSVFHADAPKVDDVRVPEEPRLPLSSTLHGHSDQNIRFIKGDISKFKTLLNLQNDEEIEVPAGKKVPPLAADDGETVANFCNLVEKKYQAPLLYHSSTKGPFKILHSQKSLRTLMNEFNKTLSFQTGGASFNSRTGSMNESFLSAHPFIFFNVAINVASAADHKGLFLASRYLYATVADRKNKKMADDASTYVLDYAFLKDRPSTLMMTLRDPVRPIEDKPEIVEKFRTALETVFGGAFSSEIAGKQVDGGFRRFLTGGSSNGRFKAVIGNEPYSYYTYDNLFVNDDILPALSLNVEREIWRLMKNGSPAERVVILNKLREVLTLTGLAQETAIIAITKLFQYPQLMVSGSVDLRGYYTDPDQTAIEVKIWPGSKMTAAPKDYLPTAQK